MKTLSGFFVLFLLLSACQTAPQESPFPRGAWEFVGSMIVRGDTMTPLTGQFSDMKMWSEKHFVFVGRYQADTTFRDNYGGGTYTLEGNRYTENILYHVHQTAVGQTIQMLLELKNDTLVQTYPVDDNGDPVSDSYVVEKYVRLK